MDPAGIEQRLMRHHQASRAPLRLGDRGNQMGIDALAITDEIGELLANCRQFVETGLLHVPQRRPDHQVGGVEDAQNIGEGRVAVQGAADIEGGARVAVEEHVFPRHQHIIEHDERIDFVKAVGKWVIGGIRAPGKA